MFLYQLDRPKSLSRSLTGKFFGGGGPKPLFPIFSWGEVTFPDFSLRDFSLFPVEISIFKKFHWFPKSEKQKKKRKKKGGSRLFSVIFTLHFLFSSFLFNSFQFFLIFILLFSIFPHFPQHFPFFPCLIFPE